jgi:hypothetical protein
MLADGALVFGGHNLEIADVEAQSASREDSNGFNRGAASNGYANMHANDCSSF